MYELPTKIMIQDKVYSIREQGDFRMVLDCFKALEDPELSNEERVYASLIIFFEDFECLEDLISDSNLNEVYEKMVRFFNCGQDNVGASVNRKIIDWEKDSPMICSAVNKVAGTEIRALPYLHWWTFMGYYMAVGQSALSTVVGIRSKMARGKKLEDYERKFKQENPQYFNLDMRTVEEKRFEEELRKNWNNPQ